MIAERFSRYCYSEKQLKFDYEPIFDVLERPNREADFIPKTISTLSSTLTEKELDPTEILTFSSEEEDLPEDDEGSDLSSDFSEFDLEDDLHDVQDLARPIYLADCIRLLRDVDNVDSIMAALDVLEKIVKRCPDDLHERSLDLTRSLLFLTLNVDEEEVYQQRIRSGPLPMNFLCVLVGVLFRFIDDRPKRGKSSPLKNI